MRLTWGFVAVMVFVLPACGGTRSLEAAGKEEKTHNPFGVKDIENADDQTVQGLAAKVKLTGDDKDANAEQWVKEATAAKKGSLEGKWFDRWGSSLSNYGTGTEIKVVGNRVYMLVNASNGKFLIDTKRTGNRLMGKYQGIDNPGDTGPCFFLVVDDERIDGVWGTTGTDRWDFRRKARFEASPDDDLRNEVKMLRDRVNTLERRVAELEAKLKQP
jgi:hypothetical protein